MKSDVFFFIYKKEDVSLNCDTSSILIINEIILPGIL